MKIGESSERSFLNQNCRKYMTRTFLFLGGHKKSIILFTSIFGGAKKLKGWRYAKSYRIRWSTIHGKQLEARIFI